MDLYAIFRRNGWAPDELEAADGRSTDEEGRRTDRVRKIRTYVLEEPGGRLGTICFYQAVSVEAIREHSEAAGLPCDEAVKVVAIDARRPDPELVTT